MTDTPGVARRWLRRPQRREADAVRPRLPRPRLRDVLLGVAAVLLAAAALPWHRLLEIATGVSGARRGLAAAALACVLLAVLVHRRRRDDRQAPTAARPLRPISWWWLLATAAAVVAMAWATTAWMLTQADQVSPDSAQAKARIDAVRTGLATGGAIGAAVALMLAFRRQHHAEVAAASTDYDATEKRITELYTKAVEQLGNDKAPVRLGGLYALERLAQNNPDLRQVVVDVICAYLRMPYTPPDAEPRTAATRPAGAVPDAVRGRSPAARRVLRAQHRLPPAAPPSPQADPREEHQVRLTAQRILADHLRDDRRPEEQTTRSPDRWFWNGMNLDLTEATLIDLDFTNCHPRQATFTKATFHGDAGFGGATFHGAAGFSTATFTGRAGFDEATFDRDAGFVGATFHGDAGFDEATFDRDAGFVGATFHGDAGFDRTSFHRDAEFAGATFHGNAGFSTATFTGRAEFDEATFYGNAGFVGATFHGDAVFAMAAVTGRAGFDGATFHGDAVFAMAAVTGRAGFDGATFHGDAEFDEATFHGRAEFGEATFHGRAVFDEATFHGNARFRAEIHERGIDLGGARVQSVNAQHAWPQGWTVRPGEDDDGPGILTRIAAESEHRSTE